MCGIAGIADVSGGGGRERMGAHAQVMCDTLAHRGPDDSGLWVSPDASVALAHRRLSIVDLSPLGRNPMSWGDGRLWITFNGEIYNFLELRAELESAGSRFTSRTDTEVVLAAYDRWGIQSVERMAGMFAFALWDTRLRRLWLVRDRLGKKPLYYTQSASTLRFASELKGIVVDPEVERRVDGEAVALYLRYGYIPSPHTIYSDIRKLPPAHYLVWENGRAEVRRYWDPLQYAAAREQRTDEAAEQELESRLQVAVRQRMIADVPLGGFLSGGIDSSLVIALMQEQTAAPVNTFTIRFNNAEFNEADHAAAVAGHLHTHHYEETCDEQQMLGVVERIAGMFDEPFADSSAVPTYLISRIARGHATVALSGDGGDELFFGYPRYGFHARARTLLALPRPLRQGIARGAARLPNRRLRRIADVLRSEETDTYGRFVSWWTPEEVRLLTGREVRVAPLYADALARSANIERAERPALLDLVSYLPEDILTKVDRTSMAVGLEVRAPLLDHRVVEFALSLPPRLKHRGSTTKWILRRLLYPRVPRELLERPKMGFGVPLGDWFRGPLRERMDEYCAADAFDAVGVDTAPVKRVWSDFKEGRAHRTDLLWQMFMLASWSLDVRQARVNVPAA